MSRKTNAFSIHLLVNAARLKIRNLIRVRYDPSRMTYRNHVLRPGLTAIAAVLALSSTPSLAQDAATTADAPPTPVAAPDPVEAPTPEPAASEVAPTPAAEPVTTSAVEPAPRAAATTPVRRAAAARVRTAAQSPAAAAAAPAAAIEAAPAADPAPIAAPAEQAALPPIPVQQAAAPQAEASASDDMLPIAGAAGAGVLALVGGAVALSRRRRHSDHTVYEPETVEDDHVAAVEPEPVAARAMPAASAVPAGLDLSRFGRHTQAAYRGPTPDNPSLSLKRRLKRASFLDGRERNGMAPIAEPAAPAPDSLTTKVEPVRQPTAPAFAPRRTVKPTTQPLFGFGQPAFQS